MNRTIDFIDLLEEYLEEYEGTTPMPEAVREAVRAELSSTHQHRGPFGPVRRLLHMNSTLKLALASAAVIVAGILGMGIIQAQNLGGPQPSDGPSPSPEEVQPLSGWSGSELPAGDYIVDDPFPVTVQMTVPAGFHGHAVNDHLAAVCSHDCQLPERTGVAFWIVTNVQADPCSPGAEVEPPIGPGVDDLVTALVDLPRHEATTPTEVTIAGRSATYLELRADEDLSDCAIQGLRAWIAGPEWRQSPPGDHDRLWILDVDGTRLMINMVSPSDASAEEVAALEEIVASIRFEPRQAGED